MTTKSSALVIFSLDDQRYAIQSIFIKRIIQVIEITRLPNINPNILGVINVEGTLIPVIDIRHYFGLPESPIELSHIIIILEKDKKNIAFIADRANFLEVQDSIMVSVETLVNEKTEYLDKILKDPDGPIHLINISNIIGQYISH